MYNIVFQHFINTKTILCLFDQFNNIDAIEKIGALKLWLRTKTFICDGAKCL